MAICSKELRIGNVTDKGIIKNFYESGIHVGYGKCFGFNEIDPIELTEHWLLKFGFEKLNYTYLAKGLAVHNHDIVSFYMLYEQNRTYIKYVHQLQNLYFALTGEELKIKES